MQCDAKTLSLTLPAHPDSVMRARTELGEFAALAGADRAQVDAVRLAVSEATTNAILHAYSARPGDVQLTAALVSGELWVLVCDDGCGLEVRTDRPGLGLGLGLMSQLSDEMSVVPRAGGGTEVRMRFALVAAATTATPSPVTASGSVASAPRDGQTGRMDHPRVRSLDRRARRPV